MYNRRCGKNLRAKLYNVHHCPLTTHYLLTTPIWKRYIEPYRYLWTVNLRFCAMTSLLCLHLQSYRGCRLLLRLWNYLYLKHWDFTLGYFYFLPCDAMRKRGLCCGPVSVCPSICYVRACDLLQWGAKYRGWENLWFSTEITSLSISETVRDIPMVAMER